MTSHDELIAVINEDFNHLAHYGVPGQHHGQHDESRRWQNHAVYARGNPRYAVRGNSKSDKKKKDLNKPAPKYNETIHAATTIPLMSTALAVLSPLTGSASALAIAMPAAAVGLAVSAPMVISAVNAYKNENKNEQRIKQLPIDEKTGLHLKTQDFSQKEDLSKINPGYNNFRNDTKNNCMFCTVAYDMRRRGYDVTANKSLVGYSLTDLKRWYPNAKNGGLITRYTIQDYNSKRLRPTKTLESELQNKLSKQGDGARGHLTVSYKKGWGAHAMAYEVVNGVPYIFDGQTNEVYRTGSNKYNHFFKNIHAVDIHRLDNIDFDPNAIKEAVH